MRHVLALSLATVAVICAHAREGIPFHTKSPTSTEPVAPERPFTASSDRFARMLVQRRFRVVNTLEAVDPAVRKLWFKRYSRKDIATGNEEFADTDVSDGKPFRFVLAGQAPDSWFILFETGGLLHHHTLVFFQRAGKDYRVVEAAYGNLPQNTLDSCVAAVRKGKFVQTDDLAAY